MNKRFTVHLSPAERRALEEVLSKGKATRHKLIHAQILLKVDEESSRWTDERAAEAFGVHPNTVREIRQRFVLEGLRSALDRKPPIRPSRERKLVGAAEASLMAVAGGSPPEGRVRWTLRLLADRLVELKVVDGISHETVRQTLKKTRGEFLALSPPIPQCNSSEIREKDV